MTPPDTARTEPVSPQRPPPEPFGPGQALAEKARTVRGLAAGLRRDYAGAARLAQEALAREALVRTELTLALHDVLAEAARTRAKVRELIQAAYGARSRRRLRRHNRVSQMLDRILARMGAMGQALVILRSEVWRRPGDLDAMLAYVARGADPEAAPNALFDQAWYLAAYPDVARRRLSPLVHYLVSGGREGRSPGPWFDEPRYRAANAGELAATSLTSLEHYVRRGAADGRQPHPLFDPAYYLAQGAQVADGEDPLSHYLREGGALGLNPHPLFDTAWYEAQRPDPAGKSALGRYLAEGWEAEAAPHPLFDGAWYRRRNPDAAAAGLAPLLHFAIIGGFEGRSPGPWFDLAHYVDQRGGAIPTGENPLVDYLQGGAWAVGELREGYPTAAYLASRPDLMRAGVTPLEHWARQGQARPDSPR